MVKIVMHTIRKQGLSSSDEHTKLSIQSEQIIISCPFMAIDDMNTSV